MNESFQKMSLVDSNYLGLTEREIEKEALQSVLNSCSKSQKQPTKQWLGYKIIDLVLFVRRLEGPRQIRCIYASQEE